MLVSLQLALYALLWGLSGAALKEERRAILQWVGYALASAVAAALLGWRPDGPAWLTHTGSSAAAVGLAAVGPYDTDHVSRFGGEEFLILMPEAHIQGEGVPLAERLRAAVAHLTLTGPPGQAITLTASFGMSGWLASDQDSERVLQRADDALYEAKNQGRDRVVLHAVGFS